MATALDLDFDKGDCDKGELPGQLTPCDGGLLLQSRTSSKSPEAAKPRKPEVGSQFANAMSLERPSVFGLPKESLKDKVRASISKPEPYNVHTLYKADGYIQRVAKSPAFENVTLAVIALNAIWMGVDTDWNTGTSISTTHIGFTIGENLFCVYFTIEWIVRFMAFERKVDSCFDAWFVFDSFLVTLMIIETWVVVIFSSDGNSPFGDASVIRLLRLLRLSRLLRMLRSLPELMILIKGMTRAMGSVMYVLALLLLITYVFAIVCTQLSVGYEFREQYFGSVSLSIYTLLVYGTFLDALSDICDAVRAESPTLLVVFAVFVGLSSLTVMNMLIGVLCEVISGVADNEKQEREASKVTEKLLQVLASLDEDNNGLISVREFHQILSLPDVVRSLQEVGVDPMCVVDFGEVMFNKDGEEVELPFAEFMEMVLDLRASNTTTVKDIMSLQKLLRADLATTQEKVQAAHDDMKVRTTRIEGALPSLTEKLSSTRRDVCDLQERTAHVEEELKVGLARIEDHLKNISERLASAHII